MPPQQLSCLRISSGQWGARLRVIAIGRLGVDLPPTPCGRREVESVETGAGALSY